MVHSEEKLLRELIILLLFLGNRGLVEILRKRWIHGHYKILVILRIYIVLVICDDGEHSRYDSFQRYILGL